MNFRVKRALTALFILSLSVSAAGCRSVPQHNADAMFYQEPSSSETSSAEASSDEISSMESSSEESSSVISSAAVSSVVSSVSYTAPATKGKQIIVDTGKDVGKENDPQDPMKPNHANVEKPQDTIILPASSAPAVFSQPASSAASSSQTSASSGASTSSSNTATADSSSVSSLLSSVVSGVSSVLSGSSLPSSSVVTPSSKPPFAPPANGWYTYEGDRYLYQNRKPVSGYQSVSGTGYYFASNGKLSSKVGIDVSSWQGNIDWNKVKAAGVEFAILRVGYRGWGDAGTLAKDPKFLQNIINATDVGLDVGIYFFTQAKTEAEAKAEAQQTVKWLEETGRKITYPIYFDTEMSSEGSGNGRADKLTAAQRTATVKAFCDEIKRLGYYPGIYASTSWFKSNLNMSQLKAYDVWTAHYLSNITGGPGYTTNMKMWQYTSGGTVNGIAGRIDRNIGLFDYPAYLKAHGWNKLK